MTLNLMTIAFVESGAERSRVCNLILRSLPDWFGIENAIVDYVKDVQTMDTWAACDPNKVIGFISIRKHNPYTAEVHVMGILKDFHRKGIGQKLLSIAEGSLAKEGFKFLQVKTLSESRANEEFERTRKFYLGAGFYPVEEFKTLWGEDNPCLLMIKSINN